MSKKNIEAVYPLTPTQQGILFHSLYAPDSGIYCEQVHSIIEGQLDIAALKTAWKRVMDRHSVLRTAFAWKSQDKQLQVVHKQVELPWEFQDWRRLSATDQDQRLAELLREDENRGFEISKAPLMRFTLVQIADAAYHFIWNHHHIILDGWSVPLVLNEVFTFYGALTHNKDLQLEEPRPYRDYIAWLRRQDLSKAEAFWRQSLKGFTAPTPLLSDKPSDQPTSEDQGRHQLTARLPVELTQAIQAIGRQHQLTLNTIVQGAWGLMLSRYSGERDVVFGATVSGRPAELEGIEGMVGMFINTLPVRVEVEGREGVISWLKRLQAQQVEARQYEHTPLVQVQGWSDIRRGLPLFDSFIVFQNRSVNGNVAGTNGNLKLNVLSQVSKNNYPLSLVAGGGSQITLAIFYDHPRFERETIERMLGHMQRLLESIAEGAGRRVDELEMLSDLERNQALEEWNDTKAAYLKSCLHEMVEEQAERAPGSLAVVEAKQTITYGELNSRANQLGHLLQEMGVGVEDRVCICIERSIDMIVGIIGVMKAGGAYVPIDPAYPSERISFLLEDSEAQVLLTTKRIAGHLPPFAGGIICLDDDSELLSSQRKDNPITNVTLDNIAYVIYTSGSTGMPKGVLVEHRGPSNLAELSIEHFNLNSRSRVLQFASLSFDASLFEIMMALRTGATLYLATDDARLPGPQLIDLLRQERITTINLTPSALAALPVAELPALETIVVGGEACPAGLAETWGKGRRFYNAYGPTETSIIATTFECNGSHLKPPIGTPIPNVRVYVLDEDLRLVAVGVKGEIYIGGEAVARGYLNRPDLTAARFIPDPFSRRPGSRLYRTSDIARRLPDGSLEYLGRSDHQVKVRGYRIELGEVESHLCAHEAVAEAVVEAREAEGGDKRLVAYVVGRGGKEPTASEMRSHLRQRLPEYMVPTAYVVMRAMPLTTNKKVDRGALPEVGEGRREQDYSYVGPRGEVEGALSKVWEQVLRVDRVGVYDNFFELGGDSILGIQIIARANQLGLRLTARQLFEFQTIAELAEVVSQAPAIEAEQGVVTGEVPLTPIQHWFFQQQIDEPHHFNQASMFELREEVSAAQMRKVVAALLTHHDALRLCFRRDGHLWSQTLLPPSSHIPLIEVDLSEMAEADLPAQVERAATLVQSSISLDEGTLLRAALFDLGSGQSQRLLVAIHHLAVDVVSWRVIVEDLYRGYEAARGGREVRLAEKTTSYKRWAERLSQYAQGDEVRGEADYWVSLGRRAGEGDKASGKVPVDYEGGSNTQASARSISEGLSEEETGELVSVVGKAYGTSVVEALMSAVGEAVGEWTGEREVVMEVEGHGREEVMEGVDVTRTVGWFTSLYPVVIEAGGAAEGVGEKLRRVKETVRGVPRRGMGYGVLRYLSEEESMRERMEGVVRGEVSFNYLGQVVQREGGEETSMGVGKESAGEWRSGRCRRSHKLEVSGGVRGGRLVVGIGYSERVHRRETVERVCGEVMRNLRSFISHSKSLRTRQYSPSDFPLAKLGQRKVDELVQTYPAIEDIYPLSPMQQSMLLYSLSVPGSDIGVEQAVCMLPADLHLSTFERAWMRVMERHQILRTGFIWEGLAEPLQVVHKHVPINIDKLDWRAMSRSEREHSLQQYISDNRTRAFNFSEPPLIRMGLICETDESSQFVLIFHHLLLDAWSFFMAIKEVFDYYRAFAKGEELQIETPRPYRDYIAWLKGQDVSKAEAFWRQSLKGFTAPTPLVTGGRADRLVSSQGSRSGAYIRTSTDLLSALQAIGRQHQLTLNTIVQGVWGLMLSRYSGERDVVFGATVSGRPAELEGIEGMVGMFINTLPVRVEVEGREVVIAWLKRLQTQQSDMPQFTSLVQVQGWSEVPPGLPLFESLLVFENYPPAETLEKGGGGRSTDYNVTTLARTNYPLTVIAEPGDGLGIHITYDSRRFERETIERMLVHMQRMLESIAEGPGRRVDELEMLSDLERNQALEQWERGAARFVKVRGYRIEPAEIEAHLSSHEAIKEAVVEARQTKGGEERLVAYVVSRDGDAPTASEMRSHLRHRLPEYMLPSDFVMLQTLPRLSSGEIDRQALPAPEMSYVKARLESQERLASPPDIYELQIVQMCEKILNVRPISPDDNFFDLGGTSISAVLLMNEIQKSFSHELPLATLFEGGTIRDLANILRDRSGMLPWSAMVPIQPLGSKPPLFMVHPSGGNVLCYVDMARNLGADQPFYGLQAVGLYGEREPFTSIEDMAAHYVEEALAVWPRGPYFVGGFSFGGFVAYEMARQLRERGREVALTVILDTLSPVFNDAPAMNYDPVESLIIEAIGMAWMEGKGLKLDYDEVARLDYDQQLDYVIEQMRANDVLLRRVGADLVRRMLKIYQSGAIAIRDYVPKPYDGKITLLRSSEVDENSDYYKYAHTHPAFADPGMGWGELSSQPIDVHYVPGHHISMVAEPNVQALARQLSTLVDKVLEE